MRESIRVRDAWRKLASVGYVWKLQDVAKVIMW